MFKKEWAGYRHYAGGLDVKYSGHLYTTLQSSQPRVLYYFYNKFEIESNDRSLKCSNAKFG